MRIDAKKSRYQPVDDVSSLFTREEERHCRTALRRLQYLEAKNAEGGSGVAWDEREEDAIAWLLRDAEFLPPEEGENTEGTPERRKRERA